MGNGMKKTTFSVIHILLVFLTFFGVLRGNSHIELVPYQIIPLDPVPDCRLEVGIELITPHIFDGMPEPQKEETLRIIYQRVAFEISNPDRTAGLFQIDGRMYHLIRIPYTGASTKFWGWE